MKRSRHYDDEFKLNAVLLSEKGDKSDSVIASDLGIPVTTLATWKKKYRKHKLNTFKNKQLSPEEIEIKKLKKELSIVKEERDILKKALAIFS